MVGMSENASARMARHLPDSLISSAENCMHGKSHLEITSRDIAEGAGTHASMVNYYFNNKSGLFSEMIRGLVANADSCLRQIERDIEAGVGDPTEIIVRGLVQAYPLHMPSMSIGIIEVFHRRSQIKQNYARRGGTRAVSRIENVIRKLIARGHYRGDLDPVSTTWMVLSLINGLHVVEAFQSAVGSKDDIPEEENWIGAITEMFRRHTITGKVLK
jgi:AcrR family transcriptional regulator